MSKLFGFKPAHTSDEPAWFHSLAAAERFNKSCGGDLGPISESDTDEVDAGDILDAPGEPWFNDGVEDRH